MYCTRMYGAWTYRMGILLGVLLILAGCATVSTPDITTRAPAVPGTLNASADEETDLYRDAITALNNSQLEQAESEFNKIAQRRPEFAGPWINLALIDIRKNNIGGAEKNIAKALDRNPKMPQAFNVLGFIEISRGNINKAADAYRQAIALKDDYAIAHYNYALLNDVYFQDMKVAAQHYRRYLALTNSQDKKTTDWLVELDRKLAKGTE